MIKKDRNEKYYRIIDIIDNLSFFKIFFIWILIIVTFGFVYSLTSSSHMGSIVDNNGNKITGLINYIYYSFITATSTGYGDILPEGVSMRFLAIANIIVGLVMMAVVTSKLVSLKQDKLLEQIYHLSFSEKVSRILSGLNLFKNDAQDIIDHMSEESIIDRKTLFSLKMILSTLRKNMYEISEQIIHQDYFLKKLDKPQIQVIISGLSQAFDELLKIIHLLESNEMSFKNPKILEDIYQTCNIGTQIIKKTRHNFPILNDRTKHIIHTINLIKKRIMNFKLINLDQEIEINVAPDFLL
jgi:hypothetical protein